MDKLKEKTIHDYTSWGINCKYNTRNYNRRITKLKSIFKRKAKRKLKEEMRRELNKCL